MVNTVPTRTPLGASTTNRKWYVDCQDPAVAGVWVGCFGILEYKPKPSDPKLQDDGDFDGGGWTSSTAAARSWGGDGKFGRKEKASDATAYDPGQEILRKAALGLGSANRVLVRIYEMEPGGPRVEAYQGYAAVTWSPDGGGMDALDTASFTLTGQGPRTDIAHPEGVTAVPIITGLGASGKGVGATLAITGSYFTGTIASQVTIGGVPMTSIEVVNDHVINAVLPAGSSGAQPIIVNGSAAVNYTRT